MPTFKPKNTKKIVISHKDTTTLDGKHKEHQDKFACDRAQSLPESKTEAESDKEGY